MGRNGSAAGRMAILAMGACALVSAACGSAALPQSSDPQQQQQQVAASTRQAYALMVAQDKSKDQNGQGGGDGSNQGRGDNTDKTGGPQKLRCSPVTLIAAPKSPQLAGVTVTLSGAAANCPHATYQFWIKSPSGKWSVLRSFGPSATASWKTAGLAAGTYSLDVWAKKPGSSKDDGPHISPVLAFAVQAPPAPAPQPSSTACTSVTWNQPTPASPQAPGTKVVLSGTAAGCTGPLYQFWVRDSNTTTWTVLGAWSASSTATWDTTGLATASYVFDIWAKHNAAAATWEAHLSSSPTYTLQVGPPCTAVTWNSPAPAAPQTPGTQVTLGGVAAGCPNPQYEFWVQAPGTTTWNILQPYSSSSTAAWNTAGLATGIYLFDIWVKTLGSSASWEAHISPNPMDSLEMGPACTSSSLKFSPASPTAAGTAITLTATSTGCPNPVYEFWVQAPGGAWTVLQAYNANSTVTWSTTGLAPGTYLFDVWVKNLGNSPSWEAHIAPNPTFTLQ